MSETQAPYELKIEDKRFKESPSLPATTDSNAVLIMAMQKGYTPDLIKQMMDLSERHEANEARKAYFAALAEFKENLPTIKKNKFNKQFGSWYSGLSSLLDAVNPELGKHGLSISFPTPQQDDKSMTVECKLSHRLGYSESSSIAGPIDSSPVGKESGKAARNPLQNIKSTFTYLRSASCEAVLGMAGTEATADDDGNGAGGANYISVDQQTEINDLIKMVYPLDQGAAFFNWLSVEDTETIPAGMYKKALAALNAAKNQMKSKREPGDET